MRIILALLLSLSFISESFGQDYSNKGKDFWIPYPEHIDGTASSMGIYITGGQNASGTITVGATTIPFTLVANNVVRKFLGPGGGGDAPNTFVHMGGVQDAVKAGAGVHVVSNVPVVVYAHIIRSARSGASLILPVKVWGKEYIVPSYRNTGGSTGFGEIDIIASVANTVVEITPGGPTRNGLHPAGVPFTITLPNVGDVYQLQFVANNDISGTKIKSIASGTSGCNPIAVFSATTWSGFPCAGASGGDNLYQQLFPVASWGKEFLTSPLKRVPSNVNDLNNDIIRVFVTDPTTVINKTENGVTTPLTGLTAQNYYEYFSGQPTFLQANKPIQVVQYITSQNCGGPVTNSDPEMIILNAVEQTIDTITVFSAHQNAVPPSQSQVTNHYFNIITKTTNVPTFRINGVLPAGNFIAIPGTPYSYLKEDITARAATNPVSTLAAGEGFSAIAYGFGNVESYGYNAGTNVKDPFQQIGVSSQYGIETSPSVCTGSPFKFKISLPYRPDSMRWDFHGYPTASPYPPVMVNSPQPLPFDSTTVVNGKTIYWYSLPAFYTYSPIGTYPVSITTYSSNSEGCGNQQEIDFDLEVSDPPSADYTFVAPRCVAETVQFTDNSTTVKPTYKWWWNFGDPGSGANNTSNLKNPTHLFSAPGTYNVRFANITTPGCLSDTIVKQVIVPALPTANISGATSVCLNATQPVITFTGAGGSAPYTFTYKINNGADQTITTTTGNSITIQAPTNIAGSFVYSLVSVQNTGSALCVQNQTGSVTIQVNPLPQGAISGAATVCQNSAAPVITFTGSGATAPYTFTYNINGGPNLTATSTGNTATVTVPTSAAGTFTYNLVSVRDASTTLCSQSLTGSAIVNVIPLPTATINGTTTVCQNAASPQVTFTGAGGTAPYTFTYTINGGTPLTATSTGNSAIINVSTAATGTFTYALVSVIESGTNTCSQAQTGTAVITVNPLPTATVSGTTAVCVNAASPNITFTGAGTVSPYTFTYNINGGPNLTATSTGNTAVIPVPTTSTGTFTYNLVSVQDAGTVSCSRPQTGSAVVTVNPMPAAAISGTTDVCLNGTAPLITFTGSGATVTPYTFTYNINGGATQTISTSTGSTVTVAVPTSVAGTFTYNLLSVRDASATLCGQVQTGSATVTVRPLPTATIAGNTEVCLNAASPLITFTGSGNTGPYTFTYNINGGPAQTVVSTTGPTATVSVPTSVAGTFVYNLMSVRDGSNTACLQSQTGSATVIVNPLPAPDFLVGPACDTRQVVFTDQSVPNSGTITGWQWNFGDPSSGANNTSAVQNPTHIFSGTGSYSVSLTVTTSKGCVSLPFNKPVNVNSRPLAGFVVPEVCLLDPFAQFTDTSKITAPSSITSWEWNFGDPGSGANNSSTIQNATHTYSAVGPYNVRLIAISNQGCRDTIIQELVINGGNPVSDFLEVNPSTFCSNDSITIQNKSTITSGSITKVEIHWDNAAQPAVFERDDNPVFNKIYRHKYPTSTTTRNYSVRFRAYSGGVCVSDRTRNITVFATPDVQFVAIPDACYDAAPFQITQATETGAVPGVAEFTGPGISTSGIFNPATAGIGTHLIKYKFTSTAGGCIDTASQTIRVLDTARARFQVATPVCEGNAASITDNSTAPAGITLANTTWDFGDGTASENHAPGSTFTHVFPSAGTYTVTMYNISASGCRSNPTVQQVTVSPIPRPNFVTDKTDYCLPNAVVSFNSTSTIADGSQSSFTYLWNFGEPSSGSLNTSTAVTPSHRYSSTGPFTVNLQVTSGAGCVHDTSIAVSSIHPQPEAAFSFSKPAICIGEEITFNDESDPKDGTTVSWQWNFGDGRTSPVQNDPNPTWLYNSPGAYPVSLYIVNSFGCNSDTLEKEFNVYAFPTVDAGPDRFVLEDGSITLQPVVTGLDLQYTWSPGIYLNSTSIKEPISSPDDDVTYTITVTSRGGCSSSDQVFVKVLKGPQIPNTFSPNNDRINDFWEIRYLDTYPNNRVQVFTRTGHLVFESRGYRSPWNGTMNGKPLPVDTYYYIIEPGNGRKPMTGYVTIIK